MKRLGPEVTRELAWKLRQMYRELDEGGRRKWTMQELAKEFWVSETTVYRAVHNLGRFGVDPLPEPQLPAALEAAAQASLKRLLQLQGLSAADKMSATITAEREKHPDNLLEELKDGIRSE